MHDHPVRIVFPSDLRRSRLTVFFRLLLAIPLLLWLAIWSLIVAPLSFLGWLVALVLGRLPGWLHRFMCAYLRYTSHVYAYVWLAAGPYPPFGGYASDYAFDVRLPAAPLPQARWKIFLRLILAIPALLVSSALGSLTSWLRVGPNAAFLGWFAALIRGRMPRGLRDAGAYSIGYQAQVLAYLLLVTDTYPNADPTAMLADAGRPPPHAVHLVGDSTDLRRSRLTVLFRLPLVAPHWVWLSLWGVLVIPTAIIQWLVTLIRGRPVRLLHSFLVRYLRYTFHVSAFLYLVANPFPAFTGAPGVYPLEVTFPPVGRQNRWKTLFRGLLCIPAFIMLMALGAALAVDAFLMWFVAIFTGRAPEGLRNLSAYALRYNAQTYGYLLLVTDAYPNASPLEGASDDEAVAGTELLDEAA